MAAARSTDHDLLIEMRTDLKYVVSTIKKNSSDISKLQTENQQRKDWQETADTKVKAYMGVASFVGGIIFFVVENLWRWLERGR